MLSRVSLIHLSCMLQSDEEYKRKLSYKQREMIADLKSSLTDLESYAYEVSTVWSKCCV